MFDPAQLAVFMLATISLNLTPGPDLIYIATRAISQGKKAGIISALGIGAGCLVHTLGAAFGLSALFMYSTVAFTVVKYLGAAYLIYLGVRAFMAPQANPMLKTTTNVSNRRLFFQGALTNVLNPKVAIFFLAFLPQFVNPSTGSPVMQFIILGLLFITSGTIVCLLVAYFCGAFSQLLTKRKSFWRLQQKITGSVFIALGLRLALTEPD